MKRRAVIGAGALALAAGVAAAPFFTRSALLRSPSVAQCLDVEHTAHFGMVFVPAGDFDFGDNVYPEEGPVVRAHVDALWMDSHEITNREFAHFVAVTHYVTDAERPVDRIRHPDVSGELLAPGAMLFVVPSELNGREDISQWWHYVPGANWRHPGGPNSTIEGRDAYPVVAVTYDDALAFARWKHHDLPTEREWEWAARGGSKSKPDHEQPLNANTWQGVFPIVDTGEDGFNGVAPAGCFKPNGYGLYDMIGNVWEWTADPFTPKHSAPNPDTVPQRGEALSYVIKGGSFLCAKNYCFRYRAGSREPQEADLAASHLGFRTVLRGRAPPTN